MREGETFEGWWKPCEDDLIPLDDEVEDILNTTPEEIIAEFEKEPGGAERHVTEMRELIKEAVAKANKDRNSP